MIQTFLVAALLALCGAAQAQDAATDAAERARIGAERSRAEAEFSAAEQACYAKFAVNDCISKARARLRTVLADLRRQEVGLNDAERRRRAADRLREIESRQAQQPAPSNSQAQIRPPEPPSAPRQPAAASSSPAPAAEVAPREPKAPADPQANARRQQQRIDEARAHKEEVLRRAAERTGPARPLPVPP